MASEYLNYKYRDVGHREKREYTPREKRRNWWHYNKWYVIGSIVGAILLGNLILTMLGVGKEHPDVTIAFITDYQISEEAAGTLQNSLAAYADDYNGDGKVSVSLQQYVIPDGSSKETEQVAYAGRITLIGDLEECTSFLFLIRDPDSFQKTYEILCYPDGTLPPEGIAGSEFATAVNSLPAFTSDEINPSLREYLKDYYIARRGFWADKTSDNIEGNIEFFQKIIKE